MRRVLAESLPDAKCKYRKKQRRNEIAGPHCFESTDKQFVPQFVRGVTAAMFERLIVFAPKKSVSRHGYQNQTTPCADATDFTEATQIVIGMFEDVQCGHNIESALGKWKILDWRH